MVPTINVVGRASGKASGTVRSMLRGLIMGSRELGKLSDWRGTWST